MSKIVQKIQIGINENAEDLLIDDALNFDNTDEMSNFNGLENGMIVSTKGFHESGDGGNAYYRVDVKDSEETADGITTFNVYGSETLIIRLIKNSYSQDVHRFGAYGDGIHDDYEAIQAAIDFNEGGSIYIPEGSYKITNTLKTSATNVEQVNIILDKSTKIWTDVQLESLFEIGGKGGDDEGVNFRSHYFDGGSLSANNCQYAIKVNPADTGLIIQNCEIRNIGGGTNAVLTCGVYIPYSAGSTLPCDMQILNCQINGVGSQIIGSYGVYNERTDLKICDCKITSCKVCIHSNGGLYVINTHGMAVGHPYADYASWFPNTRFIELPENSSDNIITNSYCDSNETFVYADNNTAFTVNNCLQISEQGFATTPLKLFNLANSTVRFNIKNCRFSLGGADYQSSGIYYRSEPNIEYGLRNSLNFMEGNVVTTPQRLIPGDLLYSIKDAYTPFANNSGTLTLNNYYCIGCIVASSSWQSLKIDVGGKIFFVDFKLEHFSSGHYLSGGGRFKADDSVTLKIFPVYKNNSNGYYVYDLYIQQTEGTPMISEILVQGLNSSTPLIMRNPTPLTITGVSTINTSIGSITI